MHHRMPPSKTGWPSLKVEIFLPVMRLVLNDPKVTTPEIIDQIHELILEDRRISTKSIAEQLDISTRIKNVNDASRLSNFWNFFGTIQMIASHDW